MYEDEDLDEVDEQLFAECICEANFDDLPELQTEDSPPQNTESALQASQAAQENSVDEHGLPPTPPPKRRGRPCKIKEPPLWNASHWTAEEDAKLKSAIDVLGPGRWGMISKAVDCKRSAKQCRERWVCHLDPLIRNPTIDKYSKEEDNILVRAYMLAGVNWAQIRDKMPGRTDNALKNRFWVLYNNHKVDKILGPDFVAVPENRKCFLNRGSFVSRNLQKRPSPRPPTLEQPPLEQPPRASPAANTQAPSLLFRGAIFEMENPQKGIFAKINRVMAAPITSETYREL